jgi:hypothetical protein
MFKARFGVTSAPGSRLVRDVAWRPKEKVLRPGVVYKTHALPSELPKGQALRAIFVFGKASDAVKSVLRCEARYGAAWVADHLAHLQAEGDLPDILSRDVLGLGRQVHDWLSVKDLPVLAVHYDHLWDEGVAQRMSAFAGFDIALPPRRPRDQAALPEPFSARDIDEAYRALDNMIAQLPPIQPNRAAQAAEEAA